MAPDGCEAEVDYSCTILPLLQWKARKRKITRHESVNILYIEALTPTTPF